jgi:hypothetical protein
MQNKRGGVDYAAGFASRTHFFKAVVILLSRGRVGSGRRKKLLYD